MKIETMRIKPADPSQGRWVVINVQDFNPEIHEPYEDEPKKMGRPRKTKDEE
jgi:hypothetical protein